MRRLVFIGMIAVAFAGCCKHCRKPKEPAMTERANAVTLKGQPFTLIGPELKPGDPAPDAVLLANDLSDVALASFRGKVLVLSVVPSLDTPVCDAQTRRFNEQATELGDDVVIATVSTDLPFAQARWCGAAGVDRVVTLSDHREASFGEAYGVLIKELRLLARAVFVVDRDGVIRHAQVVPEIADHPDYDAATAVIAELTR